MRLIGCSLDEFSLIKYCMVSFFTKMSDLELHQKRQICPVQIHLLGYDANPFLLCSL